MGVTFHVSSRGERMFGSVIEQNDRMLSTMKQMDVREMSCARRDKTELVLLLHLLLCECLRGSTGASECSVVQRSAVAHLCPVDGAARARLDERLVEEEPEARAHALPPREFVCARGLLEPEAAEQLLLWRLLRVEVHTTEKCTYTKDRQSKRENRSTRRGQSRGAETRR